METLEHLSSKGGASSSLGKQKSTNNFVIPEPKPQLGTRVRRDEQAANLNSLSSLGMIQMEVLRAERYFQLNFIIDSEKMQAVAVEGSALAWFKFVEDHMGIQG